MTDPHNADDHERLPQPAEDPDTGSTGSTDERASENRRKGLEREQGDKLEDADKTS